MRSNTAQLVISIIASLAIHAALLVGVSTWVVPGYVDPSKPAPALAELPIDAEKVGLPDATGDAIADFADVDLLQAEQADQAQPFLRQNPAPMLKPPTDEVPTIGAPVELMPMPKSTRGQFAASARQSEVEQETATAAEASATPADVPAPRAETDSDLFANADSAVFKPGATRSQSGREVKFSRPRFDLDFVDQMLIRSGRFRVSMTIRTDADGKPQLVDVIESSGNRTIDDVVRRSMYDSWFGAPMPDSFPFVVEVR
jgi:hypothetical protein